MSFSHEKSTDPAAHGTQATLRGDAATTEEWTLDSWTFSVCHVRCFWTLRSAWLYVDFDHLDMWYIYI